MANENYSNFTRTRPNKGFLDPDQPEITEKREKREREREREKKLEAVLVSIVWTLENDRKPVLKHTRRLLLRASWFLKIQIDLQ